MNRLIIAVVITLMTSAETARADSLSYLINNCKTCFPAYDFITTDFSATIAIGGNPLAFSFVNTSTANYRDNKLTLEFSTFTWDFGDGTTEIGGNPIHIFPRPGVYTVKLTATRGAIDLGDRSIAIKTINVPDPAIPITSSQANCLFNWAEDNYSDLFPQGDEALLTFPPYTYRHYASTNYYLGVSSMDNIVYYMGSDLVMHGVGNVHGWLATAGCQ